MDVVRVVDEGLVYRRSSNDFSLLPANFLARHEVGSLLTDGQGSLTSTLLYKSAASRQWLFPFP